MGLLSLEAGKGGTVRILHFGDSHIAGEDESGVVRAYLAGIFGDAGPGYFLPWSPPRYYRRLGVTTGSTAGWRRVLPSRDAPLDDAGLSGCYIEASGAGQSCWAQAPFDTFRVYLLRQPGGGTAEVTVDGAAQATQGLASKEVGVDVVSKSLTASSTPRKLEIRTAGNGKVRVLGVTLERSGGGVTYSPMGVLGARADVLMKNRPETFARILKAEAPDLVILGYGTNEAGDRPFDAAAYAATFETILGRIRRAAPKAALLVLGPPDRAQRNGSLWWSLDSLPKVAEGQKMACEKAGASFLDLRTLMGGDGSAQRWAESKPPLAQADRVHFTSSGYALLGRAVAKDILERYNREKASARFRQGLGSQSGGKLLLASASKPTALPAAPPSAFVLASAQPAQDATVAEPTHEVYYFRNAQGVLVITDDPSYGAGGQPATTGASKPRTDAPSGVYYFEKPDGTLVVTTDKADLAGQPGRFLTPGELRDRQARKSSGGGNP
jgi:lysophospholipase L1-like esterase